MSHLLDVNVLVAWGWTDHADHERVARWIGSMRTKRGVRICTSAIPELGFVRVSVFRAKGAVSVGEAGATLQSMLRSLGKHHAFIADTRSATQGFPNWCESAGRTTDAHLHLLAVSHGLALATLDTNIPGAFVIPGFSA